MRSFRFFGCGLLLCGTLFFTGCPANRKTADDSLFAAAEALDQGRLDKALASADAALAIEPENVNALVMRAIAAERLGKRDLAMDSARMAVKINPDSFMAQYTLGRLYASDPSRVSAAATPLLKALELRDGDRDTLVLLVNVSSALDSERSLQYLNELALQDKKLASSGEFQNQLGIAYARRGEKKLAAQAFLNAYKTARKNPRIALNTATFFDLYYGVPKKALPLYRYFLTLTAGNPEQAAERTRVAARVREIERAR